MKIPNFRQNKGITLAALVITIIVLLIIATITVTTLSGNNGIVEQTVTAKEESEIKSELKVVDLASNQAKNKNKYGDVTGEELVKALKNNAGENQTEVEYYEKGSLYFVTFKKSNRVYEVTTAGYAKYVGKPEDAVVLFGKPKSSIAPKTSVEVNVIIKTLQENKIDKLEYVWNKSEDKQPSKEEFSNNTPKVLENVENEKTEKQTIVSLPEGTPEGEYYLWVKVTNNGEETIEHLGPYIIGEVSCQLAVDPNGGTWDGSSEVKVIKQSVGNKIDLKTPNPPANYEITFDADGGNVSKDKVTSVVSFNRWELKGVGTLEKNIYTFGKGKATATAQYSNEKITLPTATKDGYQIDGWYDKDGNKAGDPNEEYDPKGSEKLTAHWTPKSYELAFDYKTNGGTKGPDETQQVVYGKKVILSEIKAEKDGGWNFIGWNKKASDKTALDEITMGAQNEKVYALFKKDIKLTFKDKNGDKYSNPNPVTIYNNEKGTATAPEISEYTGWEPLYWTKETKADGAKSVGAKAGDNTISNITDPATYYARYKKDIKIEFDLNGGTGTKPDNATGEVHVSTSDITKPKAATINMPEIESGKEPKKDGYVFNGWNTAQDGKGTHYDIDGTGSFVDSTTLYAEWTEKKATKLTLNKETATISYDDTTTIIATLEPADLVNKNVNWTTSDANICNISKATSVSGEEITLTAKKVGKATITATAADGSGKTATCVVTVVAKKITVPTAKTNLVYNAANQTGVEQTTEYNVTDGTKIDAGSYTAKVVLKDKTNTMWNDETTTDKTVDWSIAKKAITVKADNKTRKYGEENPTLTATVGETGVQGEKGKITGTPTTTAEKMSKVGNYPITRGENLSLADNDTFKANNYEIDFKDGTLTITKIDNTLDVKAKTLTYNTQEQELVSQTGLQGGIYYSIGTELTASNYTEKGTKNTIPKGTNAGNYKVYYYAPGNENYNAKSDSVDVTIAQYSLKDAIIETVGSQIFTGSAITPKPEVKVNIPSEQNKTKLVEGTDFDYSYSNNNGVGTATVTVTGKGNYKDSKSITFTLADKKPIKVTPSNYSGTYNGEAHTFELNVTEPEGCKIYYKEGKDTLTESNYTQGTTDQKPTRTDAGTTTVQWYIVSSDPTYNDLAGNNTITINKAKATKPTVKAYSGIYDGSAHGVTVTGGSGGTIQYSEDNNEYSTTVPKYTDFTDGEKTIYVKIVGDKNHSDSDVVTSSITIGQKEIAVKADAKNRAYGAVNPELTYTHSGEISGEEAGFTGALETEAKETSAPGNYDITQGDLALADNGTFKAANYKIIYTKASLTVTKADGSGSVTMEDWTYGETAKDPVATSSTNGTNNVTYKYKVSTAADSTYTDAKPSNAGTYTVQATFAETDNYNEVTVTANFTIEQKEITVTAEDENRAYGAENPTFTYTHSGEISGEEAGFTGALETEAKETSAPGNYDITQGNLALADNGTFKAANYEIKYTTAILRVDPKVTFNANDGTETISEQTVIYNTQIALKQNTFTRGGYTFNEWNTEADGSGTPYADKANITTEVNITLYAQWTANKYTISYDYAEGTAGTNAPTSATYNEDVQISNPTKEGYTFGGWTSSSSDGLGENAKTGTEANPSTEWTGEPTKNTYFKNLTDTNNGTVKLIATWKANYKLRKVIGTSNLIANGGFDNYSLVDAPSKNSNGVTHTWDKDLNGVPGNTTKAYKMTSWDEYANGTGANMGVVVPEIGYHAHMRIVNGNNVLRFKTNEAYVGKTGANVSGGKSVTPGTINANRWLGISQLLTGTNLTAGATYVVTLDAYRVSGNQKITGGLYYATNSNAERAFNSGQFAFRPTKTGEWETFSWTFTLGSNYKNTINPSLYVYGCLDGTGEIYVDNVRLERYDNTQEITKEYDSLYTTEELNTPSRTGYAFDGWYSDARYTKRLDETDKFNTNTAVFEDINTPETSAYIYAKWSYNSYTIKFDKNNANAIGTMQPMTASRGTAITLNGNTFNVPAGIATKQIFNGWNTKADGTGTNYSDKESVTDLSTAGESVTLYAQWIDALYEVIEPSKYTLTMQEAITAANANTTIKVIRNGSDNYAANVNKTLTLDLNNKTLTRLEQITVSQGNFNVLGTGGTGKDGTLYSKGKGIYNIGSSSSVTISNYATIKCNDRAIEFKSDGRSFSGSLNIENSWIYTTVKANAIVIGSANSVTINNSWVYMPYGSACTIVVNYELSQMTIKGASRIGSGWLDDSNHSTLIYFGSGSNGTTIYIQNKSIIMSGQYNYAAITLDRTATLEVKDEAEIYALRNNINTKCINCKKTGCTISIDTYGWVYSRGTYVISSNSNSPVSLLKGTYVAASQKMVDYTRDYDTLGGTHPHQFYYMKVYNDIALSDGFDLYEFGRGWVKVGNTYTYDWRFFWSNNTLARGLNTIGNGIYYFNENGVMQTGWRHIDNYWYCFKAKTGTSGGEAYTGGPHIIDGKKYIFDNDGKMLTGWAYGSDGYWYYLNPTETSSYKLGEALKGWHYIEGEWYCMNADHRMLTGGPHIIDGKKYIFGSDGKMLTGWAKDSYGYWYYLNPAESTSSIKKGEALKGWHYIDGAWYCMNGDYHMLTGGPHLLDGNKFIFASNGKMLTGWQQAGGKWYYLNPSDGKAKKGWYYDNSYQAWYYFEPSGTNMCQMLANTTRVIDGKTYKFAADGKWIQ